MEAFPPVLLETLQRPQGIVILCGLRESGALETARRMVKSLTGKTVFVLTEDDPGGEDSAAVKQAAVILIEGHVSADRLRRCVTMAEEGRLVFFSQAAPTAATVLRRWLSEDFGEGRAHFLWRLSDQLLWVAGQMRVPGIATAAGAAPSVDVFEILLMTPRLRGFLEKEDFISIDADLQGGQESSGTVSFNQSLLQLLLRRQIEIPTAFQFTRDPVHLDAILKKVGI